MQTQILILQYEYANHSVLAMIPAAPLGRVGAANIRNQIQGFFLKPFFLYYKKKTSLELGKCLFFKH